MKVQTALATGLFLCLNGVIGAIAIPSPAPAFGQASEAASNIFFRTKSYGVQISWRRGRPYMTVSNNGWRVIADAPAQFVAPRGSGDTWVTYLANSGDYNAYVRVGPDGEGMIEVTLSGSRVTREYSFFPSRKPLKQPARQPEKDSTMLAFQTADYAVRVYRQKGNLWMNLYDIKSATTRLKQVPVTVANTSEGTVYRYDGDATVQAREDYRGQRSLLILRDNQITYRGEGN